MALKDKYKTNSKLANEGVWVDFTDQPNEDGTVPGFKLGRKTNQNKAYARAMREFTKEHTTEDGVFDLSTLPEEEAEAIELNIFAAALCLDWRNFQPEDDGKVLDYSLDNVKLIFGDSDWVDFYRVLASKAGKATAYKIKQQKAEAKN